MVTFKVFRKISCGEEITSYYGPQYFDDNNCECKCITREERGISLISIDGIFVDGVPSSRKPQERHWICMRTNAKK